MDSVAFVSSLQKTNHIAVLCTGNTTDNLICLLFSPFRASKWKPTKEPKNKKSWSFRKNINLG